MRVSALLLAAGSGQRFGAAEPKQFLRFAGKPLLRRAAEALLAEGLVEVLQPVAAPEHLDRVAAILEGLPSLAPVAGGATRQDSVRLGLEALAQGDAPDLVLVHDAARPVVPRGTVAALLAALREAPGAIPALPVTDTLKRCDDGAIAATVPREALYRAQTPQGFRFPALLAAHRAGHAGATDDAALLELSGERVLIIPGAEENVKVTVQEDLARMELLRRAALLPRTGTGYDVHRMAEGRPMILCGITVPHELGLDGHSDADVGIHALCDALYGAMADGDIGRHFPPSENQWKDADSARFLRHAAARVAERGGVIANADVTIICERPKITPHAAAMRARLAELMGIPLSRVSVKATTSERLGFTGRGEGIAAQAAVSVLLPED